MRNRAKWTILNVGLASVLALAAAPALATTTDLIVNGGFETGNLTGWTPSGTGTVSAVTTDTVGNGANAVTISPFTGNWMADIILAGNTDKTVTLSQSISPATFDSALFSFAYRLASNDQAGGNTGSGTLIDGNLIATLKINSVPTFTQTYTTNDTDTGSHWTVGAWTVDGLSSIGSGVNVTLDLSFQANSLNSDNNNDEVRVYLDAISFQATKNDGNGGGTGGNTDPNGTSVPEPVTAALGLVGLASLALAATRRRKA